jgi:hypothetical protein
MGEREMSQAAEPKASRLRLLAERYGDLYFPLKFVVVAVGLWLALRVWGRW